MQKIAKLGRSKRLRFKMPEMGSLLSVMDLKSLAGLRAILRIITHNIGGFLDIHAGKQKSMFNLGFEAARWTYNKAKEICDNLKSIGEKVPKKYDLRDNVLSIISERFADVPFLVKAGGVLDYYNSRSNAIKVDPGTRTFLIWYAGDSCGKIGEQDFNRIYRLCLNLDKLIGKRALSRNHRERRELKKASDRFRNRIRDLITELHRKAALFLVSNFDVILLPTFQTKGMTERNKRRIDSDSARNMTTFSHFKFKQFVKHKALQRGKVVINVNEAHTSDCELDW